MYITHSECAFGQYLLAWTDFVELPRSLLLIGQAHKQVHSYSTSISRGAKTEKRAFRSPLATEKV